MYAWPICGMAGRVTVARPTRAERRRIAALSASAGRGDKSLFHPSNASPPHDVAGKTVTGSPRMARLAWGRS